MKNKNMKDKKLSVKIKLGRKIKTIFPVLKISKDDIKIIKKINYTNTTYNNIFSISTTSKPTRNFINYEYFVDLENGFNDRLKVVGIDFCETRKRVSSLIIGTSSIRGNAYIEPIVKELQQKAEKTENLKEAISILNRLFILNVDIPSFVKYIKFNDSFLETQRKYSEKSKKDEIEKKVEEFTLNLIKNKIRTKKYEKC